MNLLDVRFENDPQLDAKHPKLQAVTCIRPVCSSTSPVDGGQTMYKKVNFISN